jgi:hypothetical protein
MVLTPDASGCEPQFVTVFAGDRLDQGKQLFAGDR